MSKCVCRSGLAALVVAVASVLAAPSARADDAPTFTPPAPPPEPPTEGAARWQPGDPLPTGYHVERPAAGRTVAMAGAGVFVLSYVPTVALGMIGSLLCATWAHADGGSGCEASPALLFIPGAGPLLFAHASHAADSILIVSGVAQLGGLVFAIGGAVAESHSKPSLVRDAAPVASTRRVWLVPSVSSGSAGMVVRGSF